MRGKLKEEIKQTKPFDNFEVEVYLNLLRTTQALEDNVARALKAEGLSSPQYNVLRILRGAGDDGLSCGEISGRMVQRVPDVTRLLDRLEARGWVDRRRGSDDRRVVRARITKEGLRLLKPLDSRLADLHVAHLGHLGERKLKQLITLLEEARTKEG